jgi:hypothetical protein
MSVAEPSTGRPSAYCSVACRRVAEFEIRRLTRKLDDLENVRLHLQEPGVLASELRDIDGRTPRQQLDDVEHTIATVETRLRALLDDETERGD